MPRFRWVRRRQFRVMFVVDAMRSSQTRYGMRWTCALGLLLAGCQSVAPTPMTLPAVEVPKLPAVSSVDPELVDQFATWLDQDAWQVDLTWSALTLDARSVLVPRWVFLPGRKPSDKPKDAADKPTTAKNPVNEESDTAQVARWRALWHGTARTLEATDQNAVTQVLRELSRRDHRLGANATILLARITDHSDATDLADRLAHIAGGQYDGTPTTAKVPTATRAAATEAWCATLRHSADDAGTALAPLGELLQRPGLPDELRTTLWRTLAISIPPDHLPQLSTTLSRKWDGTPTGETLKRAALDACIIHAVANSAAMTEWDAALWPPQIEALRYDTDARSRQLFGRWLALSQHPQAATWLAAQLRDTEPMVREVALQSLGQLSTDSAREELLKSAQRETGRPRALAVHALAQHSIQDVLKFTRDPSGEVRSAVGRSLVQHPSDETATALRPLLSDTHPDVPATVLTTIQAWPLEWRLPLLLEAVRSGSLVTRQAAVFALRDAIPDLPDLPIDGRPEERDQAVQQVARTHNVRLDFRSHPQEQHPDSRVARAEDEARIAVIQETVRQYLAATPQSIDANEAWDRLLQIATVSDLPAMEQVLTQEQGKPAVEMVRHELLPRISPAYAALLDLESRDVVLRRRGARALVMSTEQSPLTTGVLVRLRELLTYEQDQQVWQSCLAALQPDAHVEAGPILLLAINQMWPDIRRLGVDVVTRHPSPEAAMWLLPLLADPQRTVRLAAIRAVAACGNPVVIDGLPASNGAPAVAGLRSVMTERDDELRLAAIVSAATLHDEQALQELTRLSQHTTPAMRDFGVQAMAKTGQPRFVDTLIRMGWTETADPVKLSILKSLDALTPEERRPPELTGLVVNASIDDKIKAWARWGEGQRRRATAATSSGDAR